jgi:hypothetical protein
MLARYAARALQRFSRLVGDEVLFGNPARNRQDGWAAMPISAARDEVIGRLDASLLIAKCFPDSWKFFPTTFELKISQKPPFPAVFLGLQGGRTCRYSYISPKNPWYQGIAMETGSHKTAHTTTRPLQTVYFR